MATFWKKCVLVKSFYTDLVEECSSRERVKFFTQVILLVAKILTSQFRTSAYPADRIKMQCRSSPCTDGEHNVQSSHRDNSSEMEKSFQVVHDISMAMVTYNNIFLEFCTAHFYSWSSQRPFNSYILLKLTWLSSERSIIVSLLDLHFPTWGTCCCGAVCKACFGTKDFAV